MRPGTRGCADAKDPALLCCEEAALTCSASFYLRLNDQNWKKAEIHATATLLFGGRAAEEKSERLSRIDMKQLALSRLTLTVKGL